ncbi:Uncharacterized protein LARI1_G003929 [Lachnellula arida]|uniref:Homing endonuclease LAGLIDADG domain-containing protein n=1 Tax=Lachnellula arida TaxID=1316785 RepID=A0A8T9BJQ8_9HELO|nr:Uncharacterized protein LARI1_G003929 [Lachnellula arida]
MTTGTISLHGDTKVQYRVSSIKDLQVVIQHFDNFPLITQKSAFELIKCKQHLSLEGLIKIVSIKASINLGLPIVLSQAFPEVIPSGRFVSAEGNFFINILNSKTKIGKQIVLIFSISQHSRDANLLRSIMDFLGCGGYYSSSTREEGNFSVAKFYHIEQQIIPFFKSYPILGVKFLDYSDFCKVVGIMKAKEHLTQKGLAKVEKIKNGMNTKRII